MQRPKSQRHVDAANARWRVRAPVAEPVDTRQAFVLPLKEQGYLCLRIEPRAGYIAWRAVDVDTEQVVHCAGLKVLLRWIAVQLPKQLALRNHRH